MTTTEAPTDTDRRASYLNKVRALLTQAEDPGCSPEEAKIFSAKAQSLMEKFSFSLIELEACGKRERDEIIHTTFFVDNPYAKGKQDLWFRIGQANGVKVVVSHDVRRPKSVDVKQEDGKILRKFVRDSKGEIVKGGWVYLTGFRTDVENVELLFTSLLIQGTNEMLNAEQPSWENTRSFRASFLYGYSHAIGRRLAQATKAVQEEQVVKFQKDSGHNLLPVLASRAAQVEEEVKKYHGKLRSASGGSGSSGTGYGAGSSAAGRANLGRSSVGSRKALGS